MQGTKYNLYNAQEAFEIWGILTPYKSVRRLKVGDYVVFTFSYCNYPTASVYLNFSLLLKEDNNKISINMLPLKNTSESLLKPSINYKRYLSNSSNVSKINFDGVTNESYEFI